MPRIRTIKPESAADAEFIGLFNGEGHLDLAKAGRGMSLVPRVRIVLRDDDAPALRWCQQRFGGSLSPRPATRSVCWQLTGRDAVSAVISLLLSARIPSKKTAEALLMGEALALIPQRGEHITDRAASRLRQLREDLKALRQYRRAGN